MSEFLEVKTADLVGAALDWAVAKAEVHQPLTMPMERVDYAVGVTTVDAEGKLTGFACRYSTDWSQGGPLIESEELTVKPSAWDWKGACVLWRAQEQDASTYFEHTNLLVAAMRAIVDSVLGETVSVPKELLS